MHASNAIRPIGSRARPSGRAAPGRSEDRPLRAGLTRARPSRGRRGCSPLQLSMTKMLPPDPESIEVQIHDWSCIEREHLADDQTADNREAQRAPQLATGSEAK